MSGMANNDLYGRTSFEWDELADEGVKFLMERARLRRLTSYTEMNTTLSRRTGQPPFDFQEQHERAAMGHLLGLIVDRTYADSGVMLSPLVHYLDTNEPGPGFYGLAQELGALPSSATSAAKEQFWIRQVNEAFQQFGRA